MHLFPTLEYEVAHLGNALLSEDEAARPSRSKSSSLGGFATG